MRTTCLPNGFRDYLPTVHRSDPLFHPACLPFKAPGNTTPSFPLPKNNPLSSPVCLQLTTGSWAACYTNAMSCISVLPFKVTFFLKMVTPWLRSPLPVETTQCSTAPPEQECAPCLCLLSLHSHGVFPNGRCPGLLSTATAELFFST